MPKSEGIFPVEMYCVFQRKERFNKLGTLRRRNIIRSYTDHMKFAGSFLFFWFYFLS
jgi:hypothetical protein